MAEAWADSSFWKIGGYLTDLDSGLVYLGKGGRVERQKEIQSSEKAFYLKDFYRDEFIVYYPEETLEIPLSEFRAQAVAKQAFTSIRNYEDVYREDFQDLQSKWGDELSKVVLVSREAFSTPAPELARQQLFERSFSFGTGAPYGFWFEDYGVIGSSPETLFKVRGNKLSTIALAGTAKLEQGPELLKSSKDRREHELVIEDIKEKLQRFELSHTVGQTHLHPFKSIVHLKTELSFELRAGFSLSALVQTLSPTAALGGYPMKAALEFLRNTRYSKLFPKRYFGSTFGYVTPEQSQFIVMIRNVQWQSAEFIIESGGGVLKESQVDAEINEIRLKRETVKGHYL